MTPTPAIVLERVREWGRVGLALHSACAAYEAILAASVTGTGTAKTAQPVEGEACQNGPQGDAQ